jgi:hypothetical protein
LKTARSERPLPLEQLGERAPPRGHAAQRRLRLDERVAHVVVDRHVGPLDRQPAAVGGHHDAAPLQRAHERLAVGVDLDEHGLRLPRELADLARVHQPPALHDDDAVAGALDVGHQVRREQHADAELPMRLADQRQHLLAPHRIQPGRRLVEEDERGIVHQRLAQLDALLHPGRVAADRAVALLEQPGVAQRVGGARARGGRRQPAQLRHVRQELGRAHLARQAVVLRHVADARAHAHAGRGVLAEHQRPARGGAQEPHEDLDRGALAGAVLAEDAGDAVVDAEAHVVERDDAGISLGQPLGDEQGGSGRHQLLRGVGHASA